MKMLALDTSTTLASLALQDGERVYTREQPAQREHAACLLPLIDSLLQETGISIRQLDGIVFGRGPGSFTGLRIACSVAQGLAFAGDLPVYPVSTLAAIAEELRFQCPQWQHFPVLSVMDARMNQVYWSLDSGTGVAAEQVTEAALIDIETPGPVILAGLGFEDYLGNFSERQLPKITAKRSVYPQASAMLRLVKKNAIKPVSPELALPVYIRNQIVSEKIHG